MSRHATFKSTKAGRELTLTRRAIRAQKGHVR